MTVCVVNFTATGCCGGYNHPWKKKKSGSKIHGHAFVRKRSSDAAEAEDLCGLLGQWGHWGHCSMSFTGHSPLGVGDLSSHVSFWSGQTQLHSTLWCDKMEKKCCSLQMNLIFSISILMDLCRHSYCPKYTSSCSLGIIFSLEKNI